MSKKKTNASAPAPAPKAAPAPVPQPSANANEEGITMEMADAAIKAYNAAHPEQRAETVESIKAITGGRANWLKVTDPAVIAALYQKFKE